MSERMAGQKMALGRLVPGKMQMRMQLLEQLDHPQIAFSQ